MRRLTLALTLLFSFLGGCAVTPMTFEEELQTDRATRNDFPDYDAQMPRMVGLQYARAAKHATENPELDIPKGTERGFQVPFAIWDFAAGDSFGGAMAVLDWFNSGMSDEKHAAYYFNRGLGFVANPNVSYYTFLPGNEKPSADDVSRTWQHAHSLFERVFNSSGECHQWGWTEKHQHALTYGKNVPGLYKEVLYKCPHPLDPTDVQRVHVTAWANPFPGTSVIGTVQSQCSSKAERGEIFSDTRDCGVKQARRHLKLIWGLPKEWMQLTCTPTCDSSDLI